MAWYENNQHLVDEHLLIRQDMLKNANLRNYKGAVLEQQETVYLQGYASGDDLFCSLCTENNLFDHSHFRMDVTVFFEQYQTPTIRKKLIQQLNDWFINYMVLQD
ncbi:hypothetical protein JK159_02410 [Weissella minor]|uniref:hypothetical protein n=1 Tax=Weissella minor TaxID=1620 RepID=UPI001BAFD144|nr:hypothetical protein [Weissella minor]MBS0949236.1 hypothetical protein [Weissella minor]